MRIIPVLTLLALGASAASAAVLAPDDPSVSASLRLWLADAATNYSGGTWADSSGNGNNATTVGTVNVNAPVTYSSPALNAAATTIDAANNSVVAFSGAAVAPSDFEISQVIVFNSSLTDQQVADINEWIVTAIPEPSGMSLLGLATVLSLLRRRRE